MRATPSVSGLLLLVGFVLAVAGPAAAQAPSGEAVYKQNCAACHEGNLARMPTRAALREMTPEHVETALSSFSMRRQGASLSSAERRAVAAVSAMPGVVFSGALDGHLRAYDAGSGKVIWDVDTAHAYMNTVNKVPAKGGGMNGPGATVAGGMLFVNSGYGSIGFMAGNAILAFSVDGR